jgi:hypothetical protein
MFACVYGNSFGSKAPAGVAEKLIGKTGIIPFQPLDRQKMKKWIQINRDTPENPQ